jgi:hypothetical protein
VPLLQVHAAVRDSVQIDGEQREILVCWSALTQLARCYVLPLEERGAEWSNAGQLFRGNVVLRDARSESLWDSATGRTVKGARAGEALPRLVAVVVPWGRWSGAHAEVPVLSVASAPPRYRAAGLYGDAGRQATEEYLRSPALPPSANRGASPSPLPPKAFVLGLRLGSKARAYPLDVVHDSSRTTLKDRLSGEDIVVRVTSPRTGHATDSRGRLLDAAVMLWFGWRHLHPDTDLWSAEKSAGGG